MQLGLYNDIRRQISSPMMCRTWDLAPDVFVNFAACRWGALQVSHCWLMLEQFACWKLHFHRCSEEVLKNVVKEILSRDLFRLSVGVHHLNKSRAQHELVFIAVRNFILQVFHF
jgi:hypothetical protein